MRTTIRLDPELLAEAKKVAAATGPAHAVRIAPGPRHWEIFARLCRESNAKGNLVADAYLAALAIEFGCEWVSTDGDYARFKGLVWTRPF